MLDFGWTELLVIMGLAIVVIGPNEIPALMRTLGNLMRRVSYIKYAFTQQFDNFMREADLDDIRSSVNFETKRRSDTFDEGAEDEDVMLPLNDDFKEHVEDVDGDVPEESNDIGKEKQGANDDGS